MKKSVKMLKETFRSLQNHTQKEMNTTLLSVDQTDI